MKYYIIAGEASGDLHASNLMREIKNLDINARFKFVGGNKMQQVSESVPFMHYKAINFIGFTSVIRNIIAIIKKIYIIKKDIIRYNPNVLVLVDFSGFNLKIAKYIKKKGIKICYYILPKAWAWNSNRALQIKKNIDLALSILPFEVDFYKTYGVKAIYTGNPVLDAIKSYKFNDNRLKELGLNKGEFIAVLPGSRLSEIKSHLAILNNLAKEFPNYQFVIATQNSFSQNLHKDNNLSINIKIAYNCTYDILKHAKVAIIKSGTSSLEASLLNLPHVVVYKTSIINYLIMRLVIKIKYVSLINLILNKKAVEEYLQHKFNLKNLKKALNNMLYNKNYINKINNSFVKLRAIMGSDFSSKISAKHIVELSREAK